MWNSHITIGCISNGNTEWDMEALLQMPLQDARVVVAVGGASVAPSMANLESMDLSRHLRGEEKEEEEEEREGLVEGVLIATEHHNPVRKADLSKHRLMQKTLTIEH